MSRPDVEQSRVDAGSPEPQRRDELAKFRGKALAVRAIIGGFLMGLANLVPGISGGTMLLATGIYPRFIRGVAEVTTGRFRAATLLLLGCIGVAALVAVFGLAGPMTALVVEQRWVMYAIFIGLTLGGAPLLWSMLRPLTPAAIMGIALGLAVMTALAFIRPGEAAAGDGHNYLVYLFAGLAAASAMVLPGVSGSYLLLILGQYIVVLSAASLLKDGVLGRDFSQIAEALHVIIPVGIGVLGGIIGISNLIKLLLDRFEKPTLGVLLGLLLGSVLGLWPFQQGVAPAVGAMFRGDRVIEVDGVLQMQSTGRVIEAADFPTHLFAPTAGQVLIVLLCIAVAFATSFGIAHLGNSSGRNGQGGRSAAEAG